MLNMNALINALINVLCEQYKFCAFVVIHFYGTVDSRIPVGTLSKSFQGNFLECINLTLNGKCVCVCACACDVLSINVVWVNYV